MLTQNLPNTNGTKQWLDSKWAYLAILSCLACGAATALASLTAAAVSATKSPYIQPTAAPSQQTIIETTVLLH